MLSAVQELLREHLTLSSAASRAVVQGPLWDQSQELRCLPIHWDAAALPLDLNRPFSIAWSHNTLSLTGSTRPQCGEITCDGLFIEGPARKPSRIDGEAKMPHPTGRLKIMRFSHPDHLVI